MTSTNASQRPVPAAPADAPRRRAGLRSAAVALGAVATMALGIVGPTAPGSAVRPTASATLSPADKACGLCERTYVTWPW